MQEETELFHVRESSVFICRFLCGQPENRRKIADSHDCILIRV